MSIKAGLHGFLSSQPAVASRVARRIYPLVIPQNAQQPCLVYQRYSADRQPLFCHTANVVASRFQIDCYATTHDEAEAVAQSVRSALTDYTGPMGTERCQQVRLESDQDLDDPEPGLYRVSLRFVIWHTETL
jgi:hypothetical protein